MEFLGVLAAVLSSAIGGTAVGATRYLADTLDPFTIGTVRFGGGFMLLFSLALWRRDPWPGRQDWGRVAGLGLLFFGLFPVLFNAALIYTTAARGALALSTVPLLTMMAGWLLRIEPPTPRKLIGIVIAMAGVSMALGASLSDAPTDAWLGDLLMVGAASCMALYNVWSRPFISRSAPLSFAAFGMGIGVVCILTLSVATGGIRQLATLDAPQLVAAGYLAVVCGGAVFFLWAYALGRTAPTLVAISIAVNPVTASIFGITLLSEPVSANLIVGLLAVLTGIGIATGLLGRRGPGPRHPAAPT